MRYLTFILLAAAASGQHSTVVDNDALRVLKVTDTPHRKSALHEHTINRVMIYLNAGHIRLSYEDGHVDDQRIQPGEVRWSPAGGKHTSENVGETAMRIVEIELKANSGAAENSASRPLDPVKVDPAHHHVELENDQVRVYRVALEPHGKTALHEHYRPMIQVYLTGDSHFNAGDVRILEPVRHTEEYRTGERMEAVIVELKK